MTTAADAIALDEELAGQPEASAVALRDGSQVVIRPVGRADAPLLADGFARLSPESRRMRFLRRKDELTPAEVRYFTDVDHHDHEALGALDRAGGRGVGVARYVRDTGDPQSAEIAVTVVDDCRAAGWVPSCWPGCPAAPAPRASAASPRWSRPTTRPWPGCCAASAPAPSTASTAPWNTRFRWRRRQDPAQTASGRSVGTTGAGRAVDPIR
jgi:hypothetical protein